MEDIPGVLSNSQKQPFFFRLEHMLLHSAHLFSTFLQASQVNAVALLIDGENISPEAIVHVLAEAGKFGGVTIRRVYGNITSPNMQRWKGIMSQYALQGMHQMPLMPGKNAADIALVIDAMDLYYREHITRFCLVASDSDYTPLVLRLRAGGCLVMGIGESKTPLSLTKACTVFSFIDQLMPSSSKAKPTSQTIPPPNHTQTIPPPNHIGEQESAGLPSLLVRAYKEAITGKDTEWILVSQFGGALRKIDPMFKSTIYGQKDLSSLLKQHEDLFEIRKRSAKGGHLEVKLRESTILI